MRRRLKIAILHLCDLGWDLLFGIPMVLMVRFLWGHDLHYVASKRVLRSVFCVASFPLSTPATATGFWKWWTWWPRGFYLQNRKAAFRGEEPPRAWGGTSVGNGQIYGPHRLPPKGTDNALTIHENHHTTQSRAANVAATIWAVVIFIVLSALGHPVAATVLAVAHWVLGGNLSVSVGGWLGAWLESDSRGLYRGSAHEIGAYAVGDLYEVMHGPTEPRPHRRRPSARAS